MQALLLGHFYTIDSAERSDHVITAVVSFDAGHPIFKGHFPDQPIVPGVCQTQMLGEVLSQVLDRELSLSSAASIKFLNVVDPGKNKQLQLTATITAQESDTYHITAQYSWEQVVFFKFKGVYTA